jgi:hypothetical protein
MTETINALNTLMEAGERRVVNPTTGGAKGTKPARYDLIPTDSLDYLARMYGAGAAKYEDRNWEKGYNWSLSYAALMRHAVAFWDGEDDDAETKLPHMASVAFHAFALMHYATSHPELDDRPTNA